MQRREFILSLPIAPAALTAAKPTEPRTAEQRLIMSLWQVQDLCEEFILETCHGCERTPERPGFCMECEDVDALHWQIRNFRTIFESNIVVFPELRERLQKERGAS